MAHTEFVEYLSYNTGDLVSYRGVAFVFVTNHAPGPWDGSQVVQVNQRVSYTSADFNTLPDYNVSRPLNEPTYRVIYHLNNDDINLLERFIIDTNVYATGDIVQLQWCDEAYYSSDGTYAYTFLGWSFSKEVAFPRIIDRDVVTYEIKHRDVHFYAQWDKVPTFIVDDSGGILLKEEYRTSLTHFKIPEHIHGKRIITLRTNAFKNSSISEIILPASITEVEAGAFDNWVGTTLRFIDADITLKYPPLKLSEDCFKNTPNLRSIILPYRWQEADGVLFPVVQSKELSIYIRNTKDYMEELLAGGAEPFDVEAHIAAPSNLILNYSRTVYWGYNE